MRTTDRARSQGRAYSQGRACSQSRALGAGFVDSWGRIHVDLCRVTGCICLD
ncbi:putative leader peptide [Rhodococcoides yunnanense]|uniref:putative leader peptide n=1 Tax=Rhodococcoides yunnanense TaxID=278209 RepID=UPI0035304658